MKTLMTLILILYLVFSILSFPPVRAAEDSWEILSGIPTGSLEPGVAVVNKKIYIIGGLNLFLRNYNEEYDPITNTWTSKKNMSIRRSSFATVVYKNKIYCIGGGDNSPEEVTGIVEVYDPLTDTWVFKSPMPTPRQFMNAHLVDDKIYVIGGSKPVNFNDPSYVPNINEVYDPETDIWSTSVPPPVKVSLYASAVCDNKIYIFTEGLTQIFDPLSSSWSNGTSMPNPGWGAEAVATSGVFAPKRIYVLGGNPTLNFNQIYDPETDSWSQGAKMPTNRYGLGVVAIDDVIYALGGPGAGGMVANERYTPIDYIPEFPSWISLLITLVTVIALAVVYRHRLHKQSQRRREE